MKIWINPKLKWLVLLSVAGLLFLACSSTVPPATKPATGKAEASGDSTENRYPTLYDYSNRAKGNFICCLDYKKPNELQF